MSAPFDGHWRVTACTCGCGTVALHFGAPGLPATVVVLPVEQALVMADQLVAAAEVSTEAMPDDEAIDTGASEARH